MTEPTQWETIFKTDPHLFLDPLPQAVSFTQQLLDRGLSSALDIGCGAGRHTIHMAKHGLRVTGMDNAPTALRLTRQWLDKEGLNAGLVLTDMRVSLPFASASFGAVLSTNVIHHALLATVIGTAREIERVVCPGGMILLTVPFRRDAIVADAETIVLETNTFVPTDGPETGLPHHMFTPEEFRDIFPNFDVIELYVHENRQIVLQAVKQ
jgi:SAM-dependent methyltransferase